MTSASLMDAIRSRCPLLSERLTASAFVELLRALSIPVDANMVERARHDGLVSPIETPEGWVYTRGHMLVFYQLARHSRIEWFPWDEARHDREDLLVRRIAAKRPVWDEIGLDAKSVVKFYTWFWGNDISTFEATAAVRLTEMVRWSLSNFDRSGSVALLTGSYDQLKQTRGPVRFAAELKQLGSEVHQLLRNASEAGIEVPEAQTVMRDRQDVIDESKASDEENPLYVEPTSDAKPESVADYLRKRRGFFESKDWRGLHTLLRMQKSLFDSVDDVRARYHAALATLSGDYLDDDNGAIEGYRAVLEARPGDPSAIAALEGLYSSSGRWEEWAAVLEQQIPLLGNTDLRDTLVLLRARTLSVELGRAAEALSLFGAALAGHGASSEDAAALLQHIVLEGGANTEFDVNALELLAPKMVEQSRDFATFSHLLEVVQARDLAANEWAGLLLSQASLEDAQGALPQAFNSLTRALSYAPVGIKIHSALERLSQRLRNQNELAGILEDEYEKARGLGARAFLGERLGRLYVELGKPAMAITYLEVAHEAQPTSTEFLVLLAELYKGEGRVDKAMGMLEQLRTLLQDPDEQRAIGEVLAELRSQSLTDPKTALEVYSKMLQTDASNEEALVALEKIARGTDLELAAEAARALEGPLQKAGRQDDAIAILTRVIEADHPNPERVPLLDRLCQLLRREPGRARVALMRHAQLFSMRPDPATLASAKALMTDKGSTLAWVLALQAEVDRAPQENQLKLLRQISRTQQEQLRDQDAAIRTLERLLKVKPDDSASFHTLKRHYSDNKAWQQLVNLRLMRAEAAPDERLEHLLATGDVLADELNDLRGAYVVYEQVLALHPGHGRAQQAIEKLTSRSDAPEQLLEMLVEAESGADDASWLSTRLQRSSVLTSIGRQAEAIELIEEACERFPEDAELLDRFAQLLRQSQRYAEAAAALRRQMDVSTLEQQARIITELAGLYRDHLDMAEEAEHLLAEFRVESPTSSVTPMNTSSAPSPSASAPPPPVPAASQVAPAATPAADPMATLMGAVQAALGAGDGASARQLLSDATTNPDLAAHKGPVLVKLAELCEAAGELEPAEGHYKTALAGNAADVRYVDQLIAFYRRQQNWQKLHVMLKFRLAKTSEDNVRVAIYAEQANVAERLGDMAAAAAALSHLLVESQKGAPIDGLAIRRNLASVKGRSGDLAAAITTVQEAIDLARGEGKTELVAEMLADLGSFQRAAGHDEQARAAVEQGLEATPGHVRLGLLKVDLQLEGGDVAGARATADALEGVDPGHPALKAQIALRAARVRVRQEATQEAMERYQTVLALDPQNQEARQFLAPSPG